MEIKFLINKKWYRGTIKQRRSKGKYRQIYTFSVPIYIPARYYNYLSTDEIITICDEYGDYLAVIGSNPRYQSISAEYSPRTHKAYFFYKSKNALDEAFLTMFVSFVEERWEEFLAASFNQIKMLKS